MTKTVNKPEKHKKSCGGATYYIIEENIKQIASSSIRDNVVNLGADELYIVDKILDGYYISEIAELLSRKRQSVSRTYKNIVNKLSIDVRLLASANSGRFDVDFYNSLSYQQGRVYRLRCQGVANVDIARELNISHNNLRNKIKAINTKLKRQIFRTYDTDIIDNVIK